MGKKPQILLIFLMFLIICTCDHASCARHTQFFKVKPLIRNTPNSTYFGFLPKGVPIPPSGPSRRHNGFGVESGVGLP
ncbi:hypothetical protein CDL12_28952 [Handroanthus impetiginosus]|uniref:Uncharacterized protein n=1 Tax=Handroanthus impetiginosus TaxID=429701 RepID=A0A2G9FZR1_9LAMI|nr:hypothetical protein CDL12_28952 [Handroanthus impetiginosus]